MTTHTIQLNDDQRHLLFLARQLDERVEYALAELNHFDTGLPKDLTLYNNAFQQWQLLSLRADRAYAAFGRACAAQIADVK